MGANETATKDSRLSDGGAVEGKAQNVQDSFNLPDILGEAGWLEADRALARALEDFAALDRAVGALAYKAADKRRARDAEDALTLLRQSLAQVARRRGLHRFATIGAVEPYDPIRHEIAGDAESAPAYVKIVAQGVARGPERDAEVILRAAATPERKAFK